MASIKRHVNHVIRCLNALSQNYVELDTARVTVAFYCLSALDVLGQLGQSISAEDRDQWKNWLWDQQISTVHGSGFRSGPSVALHHGQSVRSISVGVTTDVSIADGSIEFNRCFPL